MPADFIKSVLPGSVGLNGMGATVMICAAFLKEMTSLPQTAAARITGSPDLYDPAYRGGNASINFLTCHDGFTLCDLYSYNQKHNEANGWGNTDGADDNNSGTVA